MNVTLVDPYHDDARFLFDCCYVLFWWPKERTEPRNLAVVWHHSFFSGSKRRNLGFLHSICLCQNTMVSSYILTTNMAWWCWPIRFDVLELWIEIFHFKWFWVIFHASYPLECPLVSLVFMLKLPFFAFEAYLKYHWSVTCNYIMCTYIILWYIDSVCVCVRF